MGTAEFSAWRISEKDFPKSGSAHDKLSFLTRYGVLAFSEYNTQPWLFRLKGDTLSLYIDRRYALPQTDPDDRFLIMACAGTLYVMELAAKHFGVGLSIDLFPEADNPDLMAYITLDGQSAATETQEKLFKSIAKRQMNRSSYQPGPLAAEDVEALKKAAAKEGAWLHICGSDERESLMRMVIEADYIQASNKQFRREIAAWLHPNRLLSGDGMPQLGYNHEQIMSSIAPLSARRFITEDGDIASDEALKKGSPVLAILGSVSGGKEDRVKAGRGLMSALLTAEARSIAVSALNQPLQVAETRLRVYDEIPMQGRAQVILRLGYARKKPDVSPRRPFDQVLISDKLPSTETSQKENSLDSFIKKLLGK